MKGGQEDAPIFKKPYSRFHSCGSVNLNCKRMSNIMSSDNYLNVPIFPTPLDSH